MIDGASVNPLRLCAVSFFNAWPLIWSLEDRPPLDERGRPLFQIMRALPSACAELLARRECDVALVPVGAMAEHPEWEIVPDCAIACRGPVHTVVVVGQVPLGQMKRIHLDTASRSSVLLLRILLAKRGLSPELVPAPHGTGADRARDREGALVIGDEAFGLVDRFPHVDDLGALWFAETGLPMVFALWAARPGLLRGDHVEALIDARKRGLKHAESLARRYRQERIEACEAAADENFYANYLRQSIRYDLDAYEREGLVEFLARSRDLGLVHIPGLAADEEVHVKFAGKREHHALTAARKRQRDTMDVDNLLARVVDGGRLDLAEGMFLYETADVLTLGAAADRVRQRLHPDDIVTYIIDRNVNYTNVCTARCKFCNFYTPPGGPDPYVLSREILTEKFRETEALGGIQILLQGGLNPELGLEYYEDLFRWTKANFNLNLHALSPTEIIHIARLEDLSIAEVLRRLKDAGMGSLPGGGAEILHDEIRDRISPFKNSTDEWLEVMRVAHELGLRSTCTMVFGFQEASEHLMLHLERLRALQDETGGFTAFITWPFQAEGTRLKLRDDTSAWRYLRIQALARLYLDNIANIQVSWPTLGPDVGEVALRFGANDFGSVMIEENVVSQAGAHFMLDAAQIEHHIRKAGFTPARRNVWYERIPSPSRSSEPPGQRAP